jgi:PDZ domain-containing protein
VAVKTVHDPQDPKRTIIGVGIEPAVTITLPLKVSIDLGRVGGPSAGLAFALDILEELGRNVDHGLKVAATGEINLDGSVGPIGGVKQKTIGAKQAGVNVFLVPAGENATEAKRYAGSMRVVPVETFRQALRALATAAKTA